MDLDLASSPRRDASIVTLVYAALTAALTWPLVPGLARHVPGDLGDPVFVAWLLAWTSTHLGRGWLNANIYFPHTLTLAYSDLMLPMGLQALPIYAVTGNPILAYNLVWLATFVLAGLGMFLFARELTGSRGAAFVAGLAYAFAPYRFATIGHLQVLSSAWLPLVFFGLRRYFGTGRTRPLAGAAAAWTLQNLSSGYHLYFFSPAIAFYIAWELGVRHAWRDRRTLRQIGVAFAGVLLTTVPLLLPYLALRRDGFEQRSIGESRKFAADVFAYFTADPSNMIWGSIAQAWPKGEGLLFPGLTIVVLGCLAVVSGFSAREHVVSGFSRTTSGPPEGGRYTYGLAVAWAIVVWLLLGFSIRLPGIKIASFPRALVFVTALTAGLLAWRPRARATLGGRLASPSGCFALITLFAVVMSFGPEIAARGRLVSPWNIYQLFYDSVPGWNGLRVPARFAMLAAFGLAALAGLGTVALERRARSSIMVAVASVCILAESFSVPIPIDQNTTTYGQPGLRPLPDSIALGADVPPVYRWIAKQPPASAIVELPLGETAFDVRYMLYSTVHWRPLVNGYSGGAPADYEVLTEALKDVATRPDRAWTTLAATRADYAIVHEAFYENGRGAQLSDWLRAHGAREIAAFGTDRVFALH